MSCFQAIRLISRRVFRPAETGVFLALLPLAVFSAGQAAPSGLARFDLKGTVTREDGTPVKDATAYIYTAAVRRGTSPY